MNLFCVVFGMVLLGILIGMEPIIQEGEWNLGPLCTCAKNLTPNGFVYSNSLYHCI
jgi:hypothetical protein